MYSVFIFPSTSLVFYSQDILDNESIEHEIIPTPKVDKVCCGVCIRMSKEDKETAEKILKKNNVEISIIGDIEGVNLSSYRSVS